MRARISASRVGTPCPPNVGKRTNPATHCDGGHGVPTLRRAALCFGLFGFDLRPPNVGKRTNPLAHGDGGHGVPTLRFVPDALTFCDA